MDAPPAISERKLIFLLASVQFVNILDFMIVMPLGPDFATALGIPTARLGIIGGSYTAAAAVSGLIAALFLDRFDRRKALATAMVGLVTATAAAGLADSFAGLVAARALAGSFGGPATSVALAILTDAVPPERRGRAMGAVMGAFSAASVLGVPAGLWLATRGRLADAVPGGGHAGNAGGARGAGADATDDPAPGPNAGQPGRIDGAGPAAAGVPERPARAAVLPGHGVGHDGLVRGDPPPGDVPAIQPGLPPFRRSRSCISWAASSASSPCASADEWSTGAVPMPVVLFGSLLLLALFAVAFLPPVPLIPVVVMFVGFMLGNSVRMVGLNTLTSKIPAPMERGRFMSGQSAVQHMSAAIGAGLSTALLVERPDHSLRGMPRLAVFAMALTAVLPLLVRAIQRRLIAQPEASRVAAQ